MRWCKKKFVKEKTRKILTKIGLIIVAAILAIVLLSSSIFTTVANEAELLEQVARYNDDNPESTKYLVTDEIISNVAPNTKYSTFKENIEEGTNIAELTDEDLVKTGMTAVYSQNNRSFDISVFGDTSGDGLLNQVDLTQTIRHLVNAEGWSLEEISGGVAHNARMRSADMNYSKEIDVEDKNKMINYIVFDELNMREYPLVTSAEVAVAEGRLAPAGDRYDTDVKVKVEEKNASGIRTVYKKLGTVNSEYEEVNNESKIKEITINEDGVYRIIAYTYGPDGNIKEIIQTSENGNYRKTTYDSNGHAHVEEEHIK